VNSVRRIFVSLTAVSVLAVLPGCTVAYLGKPLHADDAEVISASENEISFGVFGWGRADTQAEEHCRRFDKEAIYQTTLKVNEYNDSRIVYYNCVQRGS
jgi:hypothetical protein